MNGAVSVPPAGDSSVYRISRCCPDLSHPFPGVPFLWYNQDREKLFLRASPGMQRASASRTGFSNAPHIDFDRI